MNSKVVCIMEVEKNNRIIFVREFIKRETTPILTNDQVAYDYVDILLPKFEHSFIISLLFANDRHVTPISVSTRSGDAAVRVFHRIRHCKIETLLTHSRTFRKEIAFDTICKQ